MRLLEPVSVSLLSDCLDVMSCFSDNSFDLAIEDTEYGIGESSKNHNSRNTAIKQKNGNYLKPVNPDYLKQDWDNSIPSDEYFLHLKRVAKNYLMFGANYFPQIVGLPFKPPKRVDYDDFISKYPVGWIIWDKVNADNDFSDCELIYTTLNFPTYVFRYMWSGMMQGKSLVEPTTQQGNKRLNEKRLQPGHKPILIYKYLLDKFALPGNKILDSHSGSGSSRIACWDMGFDYIGIEKSEYNYKRSCERFLRHKSVLDLFRGY